MSLDLISSIGALVKAMLTWARCHFLEAFCFDGEHAWQYHDHIPAPSLEYDIGIDNLVEVGIEKVGILLECQ
jgi:hypothetical protein